MSKPLSGLFHRWLLRSLRPDRLPHIRHPVDVGVPPHAVQQVMLQAADGGRLFGWYLRPDPSDVAQAPSMVVMHGWGSNASELLPGAEPLRQAGQALLVLDARCHGLSDGAEFTSMPRFAQDIEVGLNWLQAQPDIDATRITLLGHSVGAAAALLLASRRHDVGAVVSLSAFAHPQEVMRRWMRARKIPMWPLGHWVLGHVQEVIGARFDDIAPLHTLRAVKAPVLLVHGEADEVAPVSDLHQLVEAAMGRDVQSLCLSGAGHDLSGVLVHAVMPTLMRFLMHISARNPAHDISL